MHLIVLEPKNNAGQFETSLIIKKVKKTLYRLNIIVPFKNSCLVKSILFKQLINSFGVRCNIYFCIKKENNLLYAHSYVKIENGEKFLKNHNLNELVYF